MGRHRESRDLPSAHVVRRNRPEPRGPGRRRRDDRGATLVEAAFVTPVFLLLIFGIIEFSGYVMSRTSANAALKAGARAAVVWGDDPMADRQILKRMDREGSGLVAGNDVIEQIWVWKADGPNAERPGACDADHQCNLYAFPNQPSQAYSLANLPTTAEAGEEMGPTLADCHFGYGAGIPPESGCNDGGRIDGGWPTGTRRVLEADPDRNCPTGSDDLRCASTDYVGIWMKVRHEFWTGFFGDSVTFEVQTIAKIESEDYDRVST